MGKEEKKRNNSISIADTVYRYFLMLYEIAYSS